MRKYKNAIQKNQISPKIRLPNVIRNSILFISATLTLPAIAMSDDNCVNSLVPEAPVYSEAAVHCPNTFHECIFSGAEKRFGVYSKKQAQVICLAEGVKQDCLFHRLGLEFKDRRRTFGPFEWQEYSGVGIVDDHIDAYINGLIVRNLKAQGYTSEQAVKDRYNEIFLQIATHAVDEVITECEAVGRVYDGNQPN